MSIKTATKDLLETSFDIPFDVRQDYSHTEPSLTISPTDNADHLFDLTAVFKNKTRLQFDFKPQEYAAEMVRSMGHADVSKKRAFCEFAEVLVSSGCSISMQVNGLPANPQNSEAWPLEWSKVAITIIVRPIEVTDYDEPDYLKTIEKWVPQIMGLSLALLNVVKIESSENTCYKEGTKISVIANRYERNPINRTLCLAKYGYECQICGMSFEERYGIIGERYIHVHHLIPVSQMGPDYIVDPINDMIPVCPNCHAMLHRSDPPISPQRLREILIIQKEKKG